MIFRASRPDVAIVTVHPPTAYADHQLRNAWRMYEQLARGVLVLLEEPQDT